MHKPPIPDLEKSLELDVQGVYHAFNHRPVLWDVTFKLSGGECLAIFSPNGAGKTTLVRILAGLLRPRQGQVLLCGQDLRTTGGNLRGRIGLLTHRSFLYDALSGEENLAFYADLYGLPSPAERIRSLLDWAGLTQHRAEVVGTYSRGLRQRLALARTLLHDPQVILLDEPFTGLDQEACRHLIELLRAQCARKRILCLLTHEFTPGLELATRLAVLSTGKLVYHQPKAAIAGQDFPQIYAQLTSGVTSPMKNRINPGGGMP